MTLSKEDLHANFKLALSTLLQELGKGRCDTKFFTRTEPQFAAILPTTWKELTDHGSVKDFHHGIYRLTGTGWLEAMISTEQITEQTRADAGRIMKALKGELNGRQDPAFATFSAIADKAGVSPEFLFNVIESRFVEKIFNRRGASWYRRGEGQVIVVPIDFGQAR